MPIKCPKNYIWGFISSLLVTEDNLSSPLLTFSSGQISLCLPYLRTLILCLRPLWIIQDNFSISRSLINLQSSSGVWSYYSQFPDIFGGHYSAYYRCPNKLYYISKSQIPIFMLSGQTKTTKYQQMLNLHSQTIMRSIKCFFFSVKQIFWMQLNAIIVESCKEPFYFQYNSKENYKMTVWLQFSILNQNFGNIQVITNLQNFLLGKKKSLDL